MYLTAPHFSQGDIYHTLDVKREWFTLFLNSDLIGEGRGENEGIILMHNFQPFTLKDEILIKKLLKIVLK